MRMVRLGENDNVKCDGLAMLARGISSDNGQVGRAMSSEHS